MNRLIRTELLKLRTTRVPYALLATTAGVTALFSALTATVGARANQPLSSVAGQVTVTTASGFALILAAVLGALAATGEFRHNSATLTYMATPDRRLVMVAKGAAGAVFGAAFGVVAAVITTGIGLAVLAGKGYHLHLGSGALIGHIAGAGVGAGLLAVLGVAVGTLVRSQLATVIGVFVWCLVVESLLGGLVHSVRPYLPYAMAATLGGTHLGQAAFGPGYQASTQTPLPFVATVAFLAGIGVLIAAIASRTSLKADVT